MGILGLVAVFVISAVVTRALAKKPPKPKPAGLDDFQVPTAEAGRSIPWVFGTVRIKDPNIIWYGDLKSKTSSSKGTSKYWMGLHMEICVGPVDAVTRIWYGERLAWADRLTASGRIKIDEPKLYGGSKKEGGIEGQFDILFGAPDQGTNDYLVKHLGTPLSAFRDSLTIVARQAYLSANSTYIKPIEPLVTRIKVGWPDDDCWYPETAVVPAATGDTASPGDFWQMPFEGGGGRDAQAVTFGAWKVTMVRGWADALPADTMGAVRFDAATNSWVQHFKSPSNWSNGTAAGAVTSRDGKTLYIMWANGPVRGNSDNTGTRGMRIARYSRGDIAGEWVGATGALWGSMSYSSPFTTTLRKADADANLLMSGFSVGTDEGSQFAWIDTQTGIASGRNLNTQGGMDVHGGMGWSMMEFDGAWFFAGNNGSTGKFAVWRGGATPDADIVAWEGNAFGAETGAKPIGAPATSNGVMLVRTSNTSSKKRLYGFASYQSRVPYKTSAGGSWHGVDLPSGQFIVAEPIFQPFDDGSVIFATTTGVESDMSATFRVMRIDEHGTISTLATFSNLASKVSGSHDSLGLASVSVDGGIISVAFRLHRTGVVGTGGGTFDYITGGSGGLDMNPAHMVYNVWCDNRSGGMGYPRSMIDDAAMSEAAATLYAEGFGLSFYWATPAPIREYIGEILRHIGAVETINPNTGQLMIKLLRGDYDPNTLDLYTEEDTLSVEDWQELTDDEAANTVTVKYIQHDGTEDKVTYTNRALVQRYGINAQVTEYRGIKTRPLALRVAKRDAREARIRAKGKLRLKRRAWRLVPGSVFRYRNTPEAIGEIVLRVTHWNGGTLEQGGITLNVMHDQFSGPPMEVPEVSDAGSQWVPPETDPAPVDEQDAQEAPYWMLRRALGLAEVAAMPAGSGYVLPLGRPANNVTAAADVWTRMGVDDYAPTADLQPLTGGAYLANPLGPTTDTAVEIAGLVNIDEETVPGWIVQIGEGRQAELCRLAGIDLDASTIDPERGILDTVPPSQPWPTGTPLYFLPPDAAEWPRDDKRRTNGETVDVKLVTSNASGEIDPASATEASVTMANRAARPYPPANLQIDGTYTPAIIDDEWELTWRTRGRIAQGDTLVGYYTDSDKTPESGQTSVVRIVAIEDDDSETEVLLDDVGTDTDRTITTSAELTLPPNTIAMRAEVFSERDGLESWQRASITLTTINPPYNLRGTYYPED